MQSFVHGINAAVAHLQFEALLADPDAVSSSQAGRPFTITDPNPPITFGDLYYLLGALSVTPFRTVRIPPVIILLLSYLIECYDILQARILSKFLPSLSGDIQHLKPPIFSITTHLVAANEAAGRPVAEGGLGYRGVVTTLEGMTMQVLEWNHENGECNSQPRKQYQTSVSFAEEIKKLKAVAMGVS